MRTIQTTLERFNEDNGRLRELIERRVELRRKLDDIAFLEDFGGLRRMMVVNEIDEIDEQIVELANLNVPHHHMMSVIVAKFIEGMV